MDKLKICQENLSMEGESCAGHFQQDNFDHFSYYSKDYLKSICDVQANKPEQEAFICW